MKLHIEQRGPNDDNKDLVEIYSKIWSGEIPDEAAHFRFDLEELTPLGFDNFLKNTETVHVMTYGDSGEIVGWGETFKPTKRTDDVEISRYVLPNFRGKGLGGQLTEEILEKSKKRNVGRILSVEHKENIVARESLINRADRLGYLYEAEVLDKCIVVLYPPSDS